MGWAEEEFGHADLGHMHRTKRLVSIAAGVASAPGGHITTVFTDGASREGAFRFVENDDVHPRAIVDAAARAAANRASAYSYVYVPVDGTSLNISDWKRAKGTGIVGARFVGARGFQSLGAICARSLRSPLRGTTEIRVPRREGREERTAVLSVRFLDVVLDLHNKKERRRHPATFCAVLVREDEPPAGVDRIEWVLLTTWPVHDFHDALAIIDGYTARRTIEEFHRNWKSGTCEVETTQLRRKITLNTWRSYWPPCR